MKLTNNRFYFDYNATSPLSESIKDFLKSEDVDFLNPSSIHRSGQNSNKIVRDCKNFLYKQFSLNSDQFNIIFHSGATEGINTTLSGHVKYHFQEKNKLTFYYFLSDHPCICEQVDYFKSLGVDCIIIDLDKNGQFDIDKLIVDIQLKDGPCLLNYTFVNNLTGVVWDLNMAKKIKDETQIKIHIDAAQSVGKIESFHELISDVDCYTYSAHKFGGLKGVGFSFVKKTFSYLPLLYGGGQEHGHRSGTQNTLGIHSVKLALSDVFSKINIQETYLAKNFLENSLLEKFGDSLSIVARKANFRNNNTILLLFKNTDTKQLLTALDMGGIEVSAGPACSSAALIPAPGLEALGLTREESKSVLRFSFSIYMNSNNAKNYFAEIEKIFNRFL